MSSRRRLVDGLLRSFCTSLVFWSYAIEVKSTPSPNVVSKTSNTIDGRLTVEADVLTRECASATTLALPWM